MTVSQLSGAASYITAGPQYGNESTVLRKVFVGNVPKSTEGGDLLEFFSQFGEIEEGPLGFDKVTGKCKGFAIFVFKTVEGARKCLDEPVLEFEGKQLQCKLADSSKSREEPAPLSSVLGYDITNPSSISSSYSSAYLSGSAHGIGHSYLQPSTLPSYGGFDSLGMRSSSFLGGDSAYTPGSLTSSLGLGGTSHSPLKQTSYTPGTLTSPLGLGASSQSPRPQASRSGPLHSLHTNQAEGPGYPSVPRSYY
ncbi:hypothetical protein KP509_05G072300 [Ceratopteris richardii]|nr:hypothetical protein KP509_05G072300 [Ceratopteris richardii]